MPGVCPYSWPYECGWSVGLWWRWADFFSRLDVILLALMLVHIVVVVVVVVRVSYRCQLARQARPTDSDSRAFQRAQRKLVAELNVWVSTLRSVAHTAPFLGLAGTCIGILRALSTPIAMERSSAEALISTEVARALVTTAAGLLVAVPALRSHNYLRRRIDLLDVGIPRRLFERRAVHFQVAQSLPLIERFSNFPAYPLIAAPILTLLVAVFVILPGYDVGLRVGLAPAHRPYEAGVAERIIVLRITKPGKIFLNTEQEDWNSLPQRLSDIYSLRVDRTLYLLADDDVPFQTVADAIDIAEGMSSLDRVRLITPATMKGGCLAR
jgi:biopolymer transport protein ExbD